MATTPLLQVPTVSRLNGSVFHGSQKEANESWKCTPYSKYPLFYGIVGKTGFGFSVVNTDPFVRGLTSHSPEKGRGYWVRVKGSPRYTVAVIDADVVPVVLDRSLDAWMNGGDLAFYERPSDVEIGQRVLSRE